MAVPAASKAVQKRTSSDDDNYVHAVASQPTATLKRQEGAPMNIQTHHGLVTAADIDLPPGVWMLVDQEDRVWFSGDDARALCQAGLEAKLDPEEFGLQLSADEQEKAAIYGFGNVSLIGD
jgi:hypothetical protein